VASAALIPITLLARWLSVAAVLKALGARAGLGRGATAILTWGGLRGGISVAMPCRSRPVTRATESSPSPTPVVIFSIVVQGLTIGRVIRRFAATPAAAA
jgi:CPA1 family monovalent cation:H+ antiporter